MTETVAFPIDDVEPDFMADSSGDSSPLRCQSPGCNNAVVKPARGRTPKYCPEHKNSRGGNSSRSSLSGKSWPRAAEIESLLNQYVKYASVGVAFFNPVDGSIVQMSGPQIVHELVELGKDDRNLRKWLEALATPGKYGPLTLAVAGMVIPILANHGLIPKLTIPEFPMSGTDDSEGREN